MLPALDASRAEHLGINQPQIQRRACEASQTVVLVAEAGCQLCQWFECASRVVRKGA